jgi:hypothetical protein
MQRKATDGEPYRVYAAWSLIDFAYPVPPAGASCTSLLPIRKQIFQENYDWL